MSPLHQPRDATPSNLEQDSHRIGWSSAAVGDEIARDIYLRVNDERAVRGLAPLAWDEGLAALSRTWSEEMLESGYRHSPESFRELANFVGAGENILMGYTDAGEAHVGWMLSDGHRENILLPEYTAIGIGVVCRNDGRFWATQMFGIPHGAAPTATTEVPPAEPIVRRDDGPQCPDALESLLRDGQL